MISSDTDSVEFTKKETLLNNIPGMLTYTLGSLIMSHLWAVFGVLYILFSVAGVVLFWRFVCPFCPSYDRGCCPCGYGRISSTLFKKGEPSRFAKSFRTYIPVFSLLWFVPLAGGLLLLLSQPNLYFLVLFTSFFAIGFVLVPFFSRVHGCRDCSMRDECPWVRQRGLVMRPGLLD